MVSARLPFALCLLACVQIQVALGSLGTQRVFTLSADDAGADGAKNLPPDVAALTADATAKSSSSSSSSSRVTEAMKEEAVAELKEDAEEGSSPSSLDEMSPDGGPSIKDNEADKAVMTLAERRVGSSFSLKKKKKLPTAAEVLAEAKRAKDKARKDKKKREADAKARKARADKKKKRNAARDAKGAMERNEDGGYSPVAPALLRFDKDLRPVYRYWNPKLRDHVYKMDKKELGVNGKSGWRFQGVQCYIYNRNVTGSIPLYHYWNVERGDDFYTIDERELGPDGKKGYVKKRILGWVPQIAVEGSVPLYRYYNHGIGDHFYTDNWSHLGTGKHGFVFEGIAANVFPDPSGSHPPVAGTGKEDGTALEQRALLVPLYRYWNVHNRDHLYTTRWSEVESGTHGWKYQGVQALVFARPMPGTVPLHRYWNIGTLDHFYTTNFKVLGHGGKGWKYEGVQCYVSPYRRSDTVPFYRYFNARINDHFYTTKWLGKDPNGWKFEGIQAYVHPRSTDRLGGLKNSKLADNGRPAAKDGLVPLFRYWSAEIKDHFYTTNWSTLKNGVRGWKYDGIQAYVYAEHRPETVPLLRFWNAKTGDHFYTVDGAEIKDDPSWTAQGTTAYVYKTSDHGGVPLYRYYNSATGDHFYTTNWKELERGANGFEYQGITCYVVTKRDAMPASRAPDAGGDADTSPVPLYRYYNPSEGDHMYTTVPVKAINGWRFQGVQGFCKRAAGKGLVPLYGYYNQRAKDHYYSVQFVGRRGDEWSYTGVVCYVPEQRISETVPLYRYFSETLHDHYYTTSWKEIGDGKAGFAYQGIAAYIWPPQKPLPMAEAPLPPPEKEKSNVAPLRRFFSASARDHMVTTSNSAPKGYATDGTAGYVFVTQVPGAVPLYRYFNKYSQDHFYTTEWETLGRAGEDGWKYEGVQCYLYPSREKGTLPLYRYFDSARGDHMYTVTYLGREKGGFKLQGTTGYVLRAMPGREGAESGSAATVELFRYYNKGTRDHFYTTRKEVLGGGRQGWEYQDVAGRVYKSRVSGTTALHVYFNTRVNDHYYTTDFNQLGKGGKYGWKYEGVEGYVFKRAGARGTVPLYQYYNEEVHDHFYTTNWSALRTAGSNGWKYNGVAAYILPKELPQAQ